eukprot:9369234-Karenia_brevis.AAC.1
MGFSFDELGLVNHAIWADNLYLFAQSRGELEIMFEMLTKTIYENGLRWKETEMQFIAGTNEEDTRDIIASTSEGIM